MKRRRDQLIPDGYTVRKTGSDEMGRYAYEVFMGDQSIGFVWSTTELSYRGMHGWNRGVRIRDFHPRVWKYGKSRHEWNRLSLDTRRRAIQYLIEAVKENS